MKRNAIQDETPFNRVAAITLLILLGACVLKSVAFETFYRFTKGIGNAHGLKIII
jgi:hypothetical protein